VNFHGASPRAVAEPGMLDLVDLDLELLRHPAPRSSPWKPRAATREGEVSRTGLVGENDWTSVVPNFFRQIGIYPLVMSNSLLLKMAHLQLMYTLKIFKNSDFR
jgi:hypothetical protein